MKNDLNKNGCSLLPICCADAPTVLSAVYTNNTPAKNRQADVPQYGRSMIEMLGVLAIIGVLSVGGIAGYSKAMQKYRVNKTIEQITLIAGNVRTFFASQGHYAGLSTDLDTGKKIIKKAKLVPDEMWDDNSLKNVWGGNIHIYDRMKGDNDPSKGMDYCPDGCNAFSITFNSIPSEACIELASHDWNNLSSSVILEIVPYASPIFWFKTPVDITDAVAACTDGNYNSVDLGLYIDIDPNSNEYQGWLSNCALPDGC